MTSLLLFTTVITITLLLYLPTLAPTITWQGGGADSGELAAAVATLGIAHPPGYPTYILLGRAWSALPLGGDVAYRLNLLSATSAAFAAAFCSATIVLLGRSQGDVVRGGERKSGRGGERKSGRGGEGARGRVGEGARGRVGEGASGRGGDHFGGLIWGSGAWVGSPDLVAGDDYGGLCAWVGVCESVGLFIDLVAAKR